MARTTIAALFVAAGLTLGACTAAPEPSAARPSCAGPEVEVSATHATPGTTLTLTGTRFMDGCNDVLPTTTAVDPYSALAITVVVGDVRFDAGSVTPDAEGGWSLHWTAPDGVEGPVTVEASADGREVGLELPDGRGRAGIGDRVALGGGRVSGGRADELLTPCGATDVWAAASIKVLGR